MPAELVEQPVTLLRLLDAQPAAVRGQVVRAALAARRELGPERPAGLENVTLTA